MYLLVKATTTTPDLIIDFIEAKLKSGKSVSLNWDESAIDRLEDGFKAEYFGVCFGEKHADGKINKLRDMQVVDIGLYSETADLVDLEIKEMQFEDEGKKLSFAAPIYAVKGREANG